MEKASGLVAIYALHNRIRLNAWKEVVQAADHAIANIIQSYKRQKGNARILMVLVAFADCTVTTWAWVVCTEYALIIRPNAAISRVFLRFIWGF